jgi:hypothetical protein
MKHTINAIESLFEQLLSALKNHNEVFLIENEDDYSYETPNGEEAEPSDYQVYFEIDKYGYGNSYAIAKLENGIAHLIGLGENDHDKQISIENFNMSEIFDLANLCTFESE